MIGHALETLGMLAAGVTLLWHGSDASNTALTLSGGLLLVLGVFHADWPSREDLTAIRIARRL